jgi:hypothetical protein
MSFRNKSAGKVAAMLMLTWSRPLLYGKNRREQARNNCLSVQAIFARLRDK